MEYIGMRKVLELIDEMYDYGQDEESKELMSSILEEKIGKHLIERKTVLKYMNLYAKEKLGLDECDNNTYLQIIDTNGKGTSAQKYSKESVLELLKDKNVKRKLQKQLEKRTVKMNEDWRFPKCALPAFIDILNQQSESEECERITGYTKAQLELWSVPYELLAERKAEIEQQIAELTYELNDIKDVLDFTS
ncbi:MAG: hypothetical protein JJE18_07045 [Eubacteriaceae bacterium]|nr:hypothetical protein [Eubacteriaceae bacterium]